jgi:hypothetical protein
MIQFTKPNNLNGVELRNELRDAGVKISDEMKAIFIDGNGDFWLDIAQSDASKAEIIVAAHNGTTIAPEPTVADKLAQVGLTLDDLRNALNL